MAHRRTHKVAKKERERRRAISRGVKKANEDRFLIALDDAQRQGLSIFHMAHHLDTSVARVRAGLRKLLKANIPVTIRVKGELKAQPFGIGPKVEGEVSTTI